MSEDLKTKLFNYEANPPGTTWDRIAAALEDEITAGFPGRLYEAQVIPPTNSWDNISLALDTSLEEEYRAKLYSLEAAPPPGTWEKISGELDEEHRLPATQKTRIVPIIRYAIAASFVGAVAFGVIKLLNQKTVNHSVAAKTVMPQNISPSTVRPDSQKDSAEESVPTASTNLSKEKTTLAKVNSIARKKLFRDQDNQTAYMTQTPDVVNATNSQNGANFLQASLRGEVPGNCPLIVDADRYLNFMNPDGSLIRVSKKLADAVGCFYGNGNSDEYKQCQEQIKKWRDKISQSSSAPSADHFMDILDILRSVQDNEL